MGTEAFWVPVAIAALGSGVQAYNTSSANSKAQAGEVQTILNQQKLQGQGKGMVDALTRQIGSNTPNQIAGKATGDYVNVLRKNAAGTSQGGPSSADILFGAPTSSLSPATTGSDRYKAGTASAQNETEKYGTELASEMGNIDAATRQRQNEGLAMSTLGTNLNLLGAKSYTQNFVDQLRAQSSGQANPWLTLAAGTLSGIGNTMAKNAGGAPSSTPPPGTVLGDGSINGQYGLPGSTDAGPQIKNWWES